jgi:von Willebrand factor type D domain
LPQERRPRPGRRSQASKPNYTGAALTGKTFCADATSYPTIQPASGSCPAANSPPTLTPLPADALLGLAAARNPETVKINYASVPMTATCTPTCNGSSAHADSFHTPPTSAPPPGDVLLGGSERPQSRALEDVFAPLVAAIAECTPVTGPVGNPAMGGTFGDPHLLDFDRSEFDFQQAGEFTLLKSTQDDFQIQVRQQPLGECCVAFNTAVVMRVGSKTIEVDPFRAAEKMAVYVNKVRLHASGVRLGDAGRLSLSLQHGAPGATVSLRDGSNVEVQCGYEVCETVVAIAGHRLGHVEGLLGNSGVPASAEFVGPTGEHYPQSEILGETTSHLRVRYRKFGASWRITQRESLFRYARGKSTRSYTVRDFPHKQLTLATLTRAEKAAAEKACRAAGITNPQVLSGCVLDVGATGKKRLAAADATVQKFVGPGNGWIKLSGAPENALAAFAPSLAFSVGKVLAAYRNANESGLEVASFAPTAGTPTAGTRTAALSGWSNLSTPILLPAADGGEQMMFSGIDSSFPGQPSGAYLLARQPAGTFAGLNQIDSGGTLAGGAVLASDGKTPLWATESLGLGGGPSVEDGAANPPTDHDFSSFSPPGSSSQAATLAHDSSGRLWLAWYANTLTQSSSFIFLIQLDPATGAPLPGATAEKVPESDDSFNAAQIVLGCNATCHVVYTPATSGNPLGSLVSWAPGQAPPITVAKAGSGGGVYLPEAAATPGGRLWIAYADTLRVGDYETVAKLGDDNGAGGTQTTISAPPHAGTPAFGTALVVPAGLVVAENWYTKKSAAIWATVVPQP